MYYSVIPNLFLDFFGKQYRVWIIILAVILLHPNAGFSELHIYPDDYPCFQCAIDAADPGDTVLVREGEYLSDNIVFKSNIQVLGETDNPEDVVISEQPSTSGDFITFTMVENTVISGISFRQIRDRLTMRQSAPTFRNCIFVGADFYSTLYGLTLYNSSPIFDNCQISGYKDSAIYIGQSSAVFENCTFFNNSIYFESFGPAVAEIDDSTVVFRDCLISDNQTESGTGAIFATDSDVTMESCVVDNCSGGYRGATNFVRGTTTITNCIFSYNISNSATIHGNFRGHGGAVSVTGDAIIVDSLFNNNEARDNPFEEEDEGRGGAIHAGSNVSISGCTFFGNSATTGSAVFGAENLNNCLVTFGFGQYHVYAFSPGPTLTCCNIYGNENRDWDDRIADQLGVNGNIYDDPGFCGPAAGNFTVCTWSSCLQLFPGDCADIIGAFGEGCESCEQTSVFLTDFIVSLVGDEAHLSWVVEEDTEDARYRLVRVNERREVDIPYTKQGQGHFQAVDYLNNPGIDQVRSYRLYYKEFSEDWTLLAEQDLLVGSRATDRQLVSVFPNPFNPQTRITLELSRTQRTDLSVFDLQGRRVAVLHQGNLVQGLHDFQWNGRDGKGRSVASGSYSIHLITEGKVETQRVLLLR